MEVLSDTSNSLSLDSASGAATITVIVLCRKLVSLLKTIETTVSPIQPKRLSNAFHSGIPTA
jgi:hypothetical protein